MQNSFQDKTEQVEKMPAEQTVRELKIQGKKSFSIKNVTLFEKKVHERCLKKKRI